MDFVSKKKELSELLVKTLDPLIGRTYWLVDCPFHSNIGDNLIWEGEICFLRDTNRNCKGYTSQALFKFPDIDQTTTILFHGGGNIGQLYREHIEFLFSLIERYPENRIVVFPQTIYYADDSLLKSDIAQLCRHKDLHFCARDKKGFNQLRNAGMNNVYLLPDMALYIPMERFMTNRKLPIKGSLYLKRVDGELFSPKTDIVADYVKDWPTFEKKVFDGIFLAKVLNRLAEYRVPFSKTLWNWYADRVYRNDLIKIGRDFIMSYDPIYSTRLHAVILALLCGKSVKAIDNSYGKISQFVSTWLADVEEVELLKSEKVN